MTHEMVATILRLALKRLLELPEAELEQHVEWLRREHIQWCYDHVFEMVRSTDEVDYVQMLKKIADIYLRDVSSTEKLP